MPSSGNATHGKCFSGILSRLLCSGSLPTHPSDEFVESSIKKHANQKYEKSLKPEENITHVAAPASTPGVVARLMGLDSFPSTPRNRNLGDFFRSKSVSYIDFLSHFDPIKNGHHQHRRVRTSVSFREGINDDVTSIILRLKEVNETRENEEEEGEEEEELIGKRSNLKCQHQQRRKKNETRRKNREFFPKRKVSNRPGKNLEIEEQVKSVSVKLSPGRGPGNSASQIKYFPGNTRVNLKERRPIIRTVSCKEEMTGSKRVKKTNKILAHKVHYQKKIHPLVTVPARERSSRKQPSSQTANSRSPYASGARCDDVEVRAINTRNNVRKTEIMESCYYKRIVETICVLTEEDVKDNWINHGMVLKFEDFEEVCQQFGQEILEVLLKQFVDELVCYFLGQGLGIECT